MLYKLYIPMARGRRSGGSRGPYNPSKMGGVDGRASPSHSPTAILGGGGWDGSGEGGTGGGRRRATIHGGIMIISMLM